MRDEYHRMSPNPRGSVQVLLSVNENSYQGKEKMHGDHPLVWTHLFDGGKSFFSSLGHTDAIYNDGKYIRLIEEGIRWVAAKNTITPTDGLQVDLDADKGVVLNSANRVTKWFNQASNSEVKIFESNSTGRTEDNPGQPFWKVEGPEINWHRALFFNRQELVSQSESCFDALVAGSGYTWLCVLRPGQQLGEVKDVNSFFGNLKNGENYEGFWAGLNNDNTVWMGSRNGRTFGRWDQNNPKVESRLILDSNRFHLLIGRMEKGTQKVRLSLFVNNVFQEAAFGYFPVDLTANASKLVIGQERDAIDHPGKESFIGSIARFMLFDRALSDKELSRLGEEVGRYYGLKILFDTESSRSDKRK
ncbi:Trehalose utilization [compost metagenome]